MTRGSLPQRYVEPDMRVVVATEVGRLDIRRRGVAFGHRDRLDPPAPHLLEDLRHLALEVESSVEDHVGSGHASHVALARLVEVRIHARAHQREYVDGTPAHRLDEVTDDVRRDDVQPPLRRFVLLSSATTGTEHESEQEQYTLTCHTQPTQKVRHV